MVEEAVRELPGPSQMEALGILLALCTTSMVVILRRRKRVATGLVLSAGALALIVAASLHGARAMADRTAGVGEGVATRGTTHLWHIQRPEWPAPRWVWTFNYAPTAAYTYAEAQVYVSLTGDLIGEYNIASLRPPPPNDR